MSTTILALSTGTTILVLVAALLLVALVMTAVGMWLVRSTRRDPPALGPLEVMADRSWRRATPAQRQAILAGARPDGALAPGPMLGDELDEELEPEVEQQLEAEGEHELEPEEIEVEHEQEPEVEQEPEPEEIEVEVLHRYHPADG